MQRVCNRSPHAGIRACMSIVDKTAERHYAEENAERTCTHRASIAAVMNDLNDTLFLNERWWKCAHADGVPMELRCIILDADYRVAVRGTHSHYKALDLICVMNVYKQRLPRYRGTDPSYPASCLAQYTLTSTTFHLCSCDWYLGKPAT